MTADETEDGVMHDGSDWAAPPTPGAMRASVALLEEQLATAERELDTARAEFAECQSYSRVLCDSALNASRERDRLHGVARAYLTALDHEQAARMVAALVPDYEERVRRMSVAHARLTAERELRALVYPDDDARDQLDTARTALRALADAVAACRDATPGEQWGAAWARLLDVADEARAVLPAREWTPDTRYEVGETVRGRGRPLTADEVEALGDADDGGSNG